MYGKQRKEIKMKKVYVVRPAMAFIRDYIQDNSKAVQGGVLMALIWIMGFITGACAYYLMIN